MSIIITIITITVTTIILLCFRISFFKYVSQCGLGLTHSMTYFIYYKLGINSTSSDKL